MQVIYLFQLIVAIRHHGSRLDGRFDSWIVTLKGKVSDQQFYYPFTMVLMVLTFYDEVLLNQQTQVKLLVEQVFPSFTSIKNILKDTITAIKKAGLSNEH